MAAITPTTERLPLESGDHLSRDEFERRYSCHPEIKKAELVEGVVYVGSPVRFKGHAEPHAIAIGWLLAFKARTGELHLGDNATVRLDDTTEVQPDAFLGRDPEHGGAIRIAEDDYVEGAPELVVEIAASSAAYDLHEKMHAYERNGVHEYIVWQVLEERIDWFRLVDGAYQPVEPGSDGIINSDTFPGLRLDPAAMLAGDLATVLGVSGPIPPGQRS